MWKQLFSPPPEHPVQFVALEGQQLTVCSSTPLASGRLRVRLSPDQPEVGVRFRPSSVREVPLGFVYTGQVTNGLKHLEPGTRPLEQGEAAFLRGGDRLPFKTRVLSREVPGFRAVSVDLSPGGIQLETEGPVPVGATVRCTLDPEDHSQGLELQARVAWNQPLSEGRCRLGLEFIGLDPEQREAVASLYDCLQGQRELSVPQLLRMALRHAHERAGAGLPRAVSQALATQLLGYSFSGGVLSVLLEGRELWFAGLTSLNDRQGCAGTQLARIEHYHANGGWTYRLLNPRGVPVLEVSCQTSPEELLGPG